MNHYASYHILQKWKMWKAPYAHLLPQYSTWVIQRFLKNDKLFKFGNLYCSTSYILYVTWSNLTPNINAVFNHNWKIASAEHFGLGRNVTKNKSNIRSFPLSHLSTSSIFSSSKRDCIAACFESCSIEKVTSSLVTWKKKKENVNEYPRNEE